MARSDKASIWSEAQRQMAGCHNASTSQSASLPCLVLRDHRAISYTISDSYALLHSPKRAYFSKPTHGV